MQGGGGGSGHKTEQPSSQGHDYVIEALCKNVILYQFSHCLLVGGDFSLKIRVQVFDYLKLITNVYNFIIAFIGRKKNY